MKVSPQSVLVIGGAGYIGAHVVLALLEHGHRVTVFDDLSTGSIANVPEECSFVDADLRKPDQVTRLLKVGHFDAAIHLAALKAAGESMNEPERYGAHNIWGSMQLLHAFSNAGIQKVVFSSSAAVYGEPAYLPVDERHPCEPSNFYGYTKLAIERYLYWFDSLRQIRSVSLRYFNAAGYDERGRVPSLERDPRNLIPIILEVANRWRPHFAVFGEDYPTPDGTCIRDYIHVTDLAMAHVQALHYLVEGGPTLICNLGSGRGYSVMDVIQEAKKVTGKEIAYRVVGRRAGDPPELVASSALAEKVLGWTAQHSSLENILSTAWTAYSQAVSSEES